MTRAASSTPRATCATGGPTRTPSSSKSGRSASSTSTRKYIIVDDIHINSKLTEGEDVADLGGTVLAYIAWKNATRGQKLEPIAGFTPDQRFFIGFAQWACENERPENLRLSAITNPHSPGKYRINGVVVNMPEFQRAFACKPGQPMAKEQSCKIW